MLRINLPSVLAALLLAPALTHAQAPAAVGAAFSMTNAAAGNEIVAFDRDAQGLLTQANSFPTNGMGTGQALASQSSIVMSKNGKHLLAVNAGSDEITLFGVSGSTLQVQDKVASGGSMPVSLALHDDTLYVLHAGSPNNITGFTVTQQDTLVPIPNSTRPLSASDTGPGHVAFSPSGQLLVVTEKSTDTLDWFTVDLATDIAVTAEAKPSSNRTPFAVAFRGANHFFAAEANMGQLDQGAVSGYAIRKSALWPKASIPTTETSTCWAAATPDKKFLYVTNTMSNSVTGFRSGPQATLQLLDPTGVTATTGAEPADVATTRSSKLLYVLNGGDGTISGFSIDGTSGALTSLGPAVSGLPVTGSAGLAVR